MKLPFVDRSPLINSINTKTNAEVSGVSFDRMRLQQKYNTIDSALALTSAGLKLGEAVYNIFEEKKLEEAKKLVYEEDQEIRKIVQTGIYDGTIKIDATDDGQTIINMPQDLTERMSQFEGDIEKRFQGFGSVRNWAKDQTRQSYDNVQTWAYKVAFEKGIQDRNEAFSRNLESAYNDAVQMGDQAIYENQIDSADWLSAEKKEYLKAVNTEKYKYDMYEKDVFSDVDSGNVSAAIIKADNFPGKEEDKRVLKKKALLRKDEIQGVYNEEYKNYYTTGKENGRTAQDIIESLENMEVPEEYKKTAIEEVRKQQKIDGIKYGNEIFNEVRDNPVEIKKAYLDIKNGAASLEYDGIPVTHKAILDMFESRISEFQSEKESNSKKEIDIDNEMYTLKIAADKGILPISMAANQMTNYVSEGASAKTAEKLINEMYSRENPEYKPFFETIDNVGNQIKDKDVKNKRLYQELKASLYNRSVDGAGYKEMQEATDNVIGILVSKNADDILKIVDQGGMSEGELNTFEKQHYKMYKEISEGEADELITHDKYTDRIIFKGGIDKPLAQMIEAEKNVLESLGINPMMTFEKQDNDDIRPWPVYRDKKTGRTIKFFPDEEKKKVIPKYYDVKKEEWISLIKEEEKKDIGDKKVAEFLQSMGLTGDYFK